MSLLYRMGTGNGNGGDLKPFIINFTCASGFIGKTVTMEFQGTPHAGETVDNVSGTVVLDSTEGKGKLTLYPMHDGLWKYYATSDESGYQEGTITLEKWGNYSVELFDAPDGATVTPTDDVQTWLHCANVWNKSYTTISEVVADTTTLNTLISDNNANDYLVRSTTWASDICNNESAMTYIGLNDYCANKLLADSTWCTAICNSAYFEKVLNVKVPTMTSNTAPSGEVTCGSEWSSANAGLNVFNASQDDNWLCADNVTSDKAWVGYRFTKNVCVKKVYVKNCTVNYYTTDKFTVYGSKTENWNGVKLGEFNIDNVVGQERTVNLDNNDKYLCYRIYINPLLTIGNYMRCGLNTVQLYGREEA